MRVKNPFVTFNEIESDLKKKTEQHLDVQHEETAYLINVFFKILSIFLLFLAIAFASFFNRYTMVDLFSHTLRISASGTNGQTNDGWIFPVYGLETDKNDNEIFTPFFKSISAILLLPESILFLYYLSRYITKTEKSLSLWQALNHFWPIFIADILSSCSSAWYLFFIYLSCPSYLISGIMLSSLWLPSVISFFEGIYYKFIHQTEDQVLKKDFKLSNILLDFIAVLLNSTVFVFTIYNFYQQGIIARSKSKFLEFAVFFCPIFQFLNLIYTWFYGCERFFSETFRRTKRTFDKEDKDYSMKNNMMKITMLSSLVKILSAMSCLFMTQIFVKSPLYDEGDYTGQETSYVYYQCILIMILTGLCINGLSYTSLEIGDFSHILPFAIAPMLGNFSMIWYCYFDCHASKESQANSNLNVTIVTDISYFGSHVTCIDDQMNDQNSAFSDLTMIFIYIFCGLPGWILTCRHIYMKTPLKFLDFYTLFSTGNIFSPIGSNDMLVTINRRRNNLYIDHQEEKMFSEKMEALIQEKDRLTKIVRVKNNNNYSQLQNGNHNRKRSGTLDAVLDNKIEDINKNIREVRKLERKRRKKLEDYNFWSRPDSKPNIARFTSRPGATIEEMNQHHPHEDMPDFEANNSFLNDSIIQKNPGKTPYIFFCPTLYQEDDNEMETLVTSILRVNRYRYNHLISKNSKSSKFEFDFEVNVFFDNCFVNKIYRQNLPDLDSEDDALEVANKQIEKDDGFYDERKIIYRNIAKERDKELEKTSRTMPMRPTVIQPRLTRKTTFNKRLGTVRSPRDNIAGAQEIELSEEEESENENHLMFVKNKEGKSIATAGIFYPLREVNQFVIYLLKTMDSVGQKVPFDNGRDQCKIEPPKITFWPYGIRLEYELPMPSNFTLENDGSANSKIEPVKFIVHLKDPTLIQKGKRWSQTMYFNYLYGYKTKTFDLETTHDIMFLALDGDIDFYPDALTSCMYKMQRDKEIGFCCGKIHPQGSMGNPLLWYQRFEYAVGHWFQKATEHVFGSVLCSPGCFSLVRAEALRRDIEGNRDSAIDVYSSRASKDKPLDIIQWNQGEDRWLCTLLLKRGWRISYVAISHQDTNAPMTLKEYFNQRRRWGPSTLFNIFDLLKDWKKVININPNISSLYLVYTAIINMSSLLTASTVSIMLLGCFELILETWGCTFCNWPWLPYFLTFIPPIIFCLVCYLARDDNPKHLCVSILSWFYAMVMLAVMIVLIGGMLVPCGICSLVNQIFLLIIGFYFLAGILNPHEALDLIAGIVYWMLIPTMLILLSIYMYFGLNNTSWGTRESDKQIKIAEDAEDSLFARWTCSLGSICETKWFITQKNQSLTEEEKEKRRRRLIIKQERQKYDGYAELKGTKRLVYSGTHKGMILTPPLEYNFSNILGHFGITEDHVDGRRTQNEENEEIYWKAILESKLKPKSQNETSVSDERKTKQNLLDLRNQFIAMFIFANSFWLFALLSISIFADNYAVTVSGLFCENYEARNGTDKNGDPTTQKCSESEKDKINPLSLVYLYFYLALILVQTIGMVIHRWESYIIYCSSVSLNGLFNFTYKCFFCLPRSSLKGLDDFNKSVSNKLKNLVDRYGQNFENNYRNYYGLHVKEVIETQSHYQDRTGNSIEKGEAHQRKTAVDNFGYHMDRYNKGAHNDIENDSIKSKNTITSSLSIPEDLHVNSNKIDHINPIYLKEPNIEESINIYDTVYQPELIESPTPILINADVQSEQNETFEDYLNKQVVGDNYTPIEEEGQKVLSGLTLSNKELSIANLTDSVKKRRKKKRKKKRQENNVSFEGDSPVIINVGQMTEADDERKKFEFSNNVKFLSDIEE